MIRLKPDSTISVPVPLRIDRGRIVTTESPDAADCVWDLVGEIVGVDLRLMLAFGGSLDVLSDAAFDTWVMSLADITLVGPLPAHHFDYSDPCAQ